MFYLKWKSDWQNWEKDHFQIFAHFYWNNQIHIQQAIFFYLFKNVYYKNYTWNYRMYIWVATTIAASVQYCTKKKENHKQIMKKKNVPL